VTRLDLLVLAKAMTADLEAARHHRDLALRFITTPDAPGAATVVAASLHHYYGAIESMAERAMRTFAHAIPTGARWHAELLELASMDLEGTRPALFSDESRRMLLDLLSFRHFFRHAYAVDWDLGRLRKNCDLLTTGHDRLEEDMARFTAALARA